MEPGESNLTRKVMRALNARNIHAVFFIQTHSTAPKGIERTKNGTEGGAVVKELAESGHSIQIHTGSTDDHTLHTTRVKASADDANGDGKIDALDGQNGLESDLIRAKARIKLITGKEPKWVRPPTGVYYTKDPAQDCRPTYQRQNLAVQLWDVVSGDDRVNGLTGDLAAQFMWEYLAQAGNALSGEGIVGRYQVHGDRNYQKILFHDIHPWTANYIEQHMQAMTRIARDYLSVVGDSYSWPR